MTAAEPLSPTPEDLASAKGPELERMRARLQGWLARRNPSARHLVVGPLVRPSATGFSNDTLLFDLEQREGGRIQRQTLVLRVAPTGFQIFPRYDLRRQFRVMEVLARTGVPVPKVLWYEEDPRILAAPFFVMERVEGRIPTDTPPYHVGGWVTEIDSAEREAMWWSGIEVLARIHRLDWRTLALGFSEASDPRTPLERQLRDYESFLAWAARGRPQPTCERALEWLRSRRPDDSPEALCWGDARLGNLVFRGSDCVAVLDWEMATVGAPEQDLAWWLFLDRHHSEGLEAPRLPGFPGRRETIARYEQRIGRRVRNLEYYEVFAAFRFAVIMIRVAQQLARHGLLPEDSDFETNNVCTRLLATMVAAPEPSARVRPAPPSDP